jgi:hypothetical protein
MQHDDHVAEHQRNGDYSRWGARSYEEAVRTCNCDDPEGFDPPPGFEPPVSPAGEIEPVEGEPPIIIPE